MPASWVKHRFGVSVRLFLEEMASESVDCANKDHTHQCGWMPSRWWRTQTEQKAEEGRGDSLSLLGLGRPISAILHQSSWLSGQPQSLISSEYGKFSFMFKPLSRLFPLPGMHAILLLGRRLYPSGLLWRVLDHSPYLRFYETPFV